MFRFAGQEYDSKAQAFTYAQQVLRAQRLDKKVKSQEALVILNAAFAREYPDRGTPSKWRIQRSASGKRAAFYRDPSTHELTELPIRHAILDTKHSQKGAVTKAMRFAVWPDIRALRDQFFAETDDPRCALSGVPITPETTDVDHVTRFDAIRDEWLETLSGEIAVRKGRYGWEMADSGQKQAWRAFHLARVEVRFLDRQAHREWSREQQLAVNVTG